MNRFWLIGAILLMLVRTGVAQLPPLPDSTSSTAASQPRFYIAERNRNLGTIIEGDVQTVLWILENRGEANLIIERTQASCGCVVAKLSNDQKVIPPGGRLELAAEFNSHGRRGKQNKTITVFSNDPAEPELKLGFTADVQYLYVIRPQGVVNLRSVRRGQPAEKSIDITPGPGRGAVTIHDVQIPDGSHVSAVVQRIERANGGGQRIRVTVGKEAALGTLNVPLTIKLSVDGIERERVVSVRAEVVGELTWNPRIVDQTRTPSRPGKRFAPVIIRSTEDLPFSIVEAEAGPWLEVTVESKGKVSDGKRYSIALALRDNLPPGPFATTLEIRTNSLDQPLIRIPVFGVVATPVKVDPPIILLRADGTPAGIQRRVRLQAAPQQELVISSLACELSAVKAVIDEEASARYKHIRFLTITLDEALLSRADREKEFVLTVLTNVKGAERLSIPVIVDTDG